MKKTWLIFFMTISIIFSYSLFASINVKAGSAGVGVLSTPPQFSSIRLTQQDNTVRAYITITDYNSWEDIFYVNLILEEDGVEKAVFTYKQYENEKSYDKINEFSETSETNNLLVSKKCSYDTEDKEEVLEKCYLNLLFVFQATSFTQLKIIASDRGGALATLESDYTAEDLVRSGTILIIPGLEESIALEIPPYSLEIISIVIASIGTWFIAKKSIVEKVMREVYEKK